MSNQFFAIDVETANPFMSSICQIGIAKFSDGKIVDEWSSLVDPESYFDEFNTRLHGIDQKMVTGKPKLPEISEKIRSLLNDQITICHTHFDRISISKAFNNYGIEPISTTWLDSARVARRTWKDTDKKGYGLSSLCDKIGYKFKHHDALEDAKAAGYVFLSAIRESTINLDDWIKRVNQPINLERSSSGANIKRAGNPEGSLIGEVIVFTGTLEMHRFEAADLAASVGCEVGENVTKKTTILVIGEIDFSKLAGHDKTNKQRNAENNILKGRPIKIIFESDFKVLAPTEN